MRRGWLVFFLLSSTVFAAEQDPPPSTVELTVAADVGNARTDILVQIGDSARPILIRSPVR